MLEDVDAVLQRIEALPGDGRYAVAFRRPDGSEQTAVVQVAASGVTVAEASLPAGWTREGEAFRAVADAVVAVERARSAGPVMRALRDVADGWDVSLGNVVLAASGLPECTAHGELHADGAGTYVCGECGARAALG